MSKIFIYNKTYSMHQFPKFILSRNSTCFGQFVCLSSAGYSLYTQQWYMSYSCRVGPGWNSSGQKKIKRNKERDRQRKRERKKQTNKQRSVSHIHTHSLSSLHYSTAHCTLHPDIKVHHNKSRCIAAISDITSRRHIAISIHRISNIGCALQTA